MSKAVACVLGLCIALMLTVQTNAQSSPPFDFSYFVAQWPGSYCNLDKECCYPKAGKPASNFSIHGLWPQYADGTWPQYCDSSNQFDVSQVRNLIPQLNKYWASLACPSSDSTQFWEHEWEKHGTCSGLTQQEYFAQSLAILQTFNLGSALQKAGIVPSSTAKYEVSKVQRVLGEEIGSTPGLECNTDETGKIQLYQVYICVDRDGASIIPCPVYPEGTCQTSVYFPKF